MLTVYVFFTKRPIDTQPWPLVFTDRQRATDAPWRCSDVVEVTVPLLAAPIPPAKSVT